MRDRNYVETYSEVAAERWLYAELLRRERQKVVEFVAEQETPYKARSKNRKLSYEEVLDDRDAYKRELELRKQDSVNRQAKNSVFLNLFRRKEYQIQLYRELFPEDTTITEDDLDFVTIENVLTIHPYNDLGLLARGKLIVLAEAQSTWSLNIIFRLAAYYFDSAMAYLNVRKNDVCSSIKVELPDVEAFVIYTGSRNVKKDILSLNEEFFDGKSGKPEFRARVIHGDYKGGIIEEYMGFCRLWDEIVVPQKDTEEKKKAVYRVIDLCVQKGYLVKYLEEHRMEVEKVMISMLSPDYVRMMSERTERIKGDISAYRYADMPESKIKELIMRRYDISPTYAQNFLDDDTTPEECRPAAI